MNLVIDFFLVGGIVVSIIILLLLFKSGKKELPQRLLIVFFAVLLLFLMHAYSDFHDITVLWITTFIFNDSLELLVGPILFLYVKSLFEDNKSLIKKNAFHFVPLIIYFFLICIPMLTSMIQNEFMFSYLKYLNDYSLWMFTLLMVYLIAYMVLALWHFLKYKSIMPLHFSTISKTDLVWVRNMLIGSIFVASVGLVINIKDLIIGSEEDTEWITMVLVVILIAYLGYYGVKQTKMLLPDFLIDESKTRTKKNQTKAFSELEEKELIESKNQLINVLEEQKAYLDEDLTLNKLAQQIETTDKKLSLLLNQYMNTTFYDFINKYRIESVKEKLKSKEFENLTLLGIAYESGFKSKTSFNRIFKKETGFSPSEYKKSL